MEYRVISADSHINEPPHVFVNYVPAHLKDKAPRLVRAADGGDGWSWDGKPPARTYGLDALAGRTYDNYKRSGLTFDEILPGNWDGKAHIEDMAKDGVDASVVYPMAALQAYTYPDRELAVACLSAYNDWLIDEFCAVDPKRLISLVALPVDDGMEPTLAELRRVIKKGAKGVFIPGSPKRPYQDPYYDPLWQAAAEAGLPVSFHRSHGGQKPQQEAEDTDVGGIVIRFFTAIRPLTNMIYSGVFERFPDLKVIAAETNMGWMPFWLQMMEQEYEKQRHWAKLPISKPPTEYVRENVGVTFLEDPAGIAMLDHMPIEPLMFSNDYPHSVTLWPNSREIIDRTMGHLAPDVKHKLLAGNAIRIFNL